jgi:hypothetical protein
METSSGTGMMPEHRCFNFGEEITNYIVYF